jgi:D-glycero-D-manno-heptose 1,7-bisphosphate phosphatase
MILRAAEELEIDLAESVLVGDKEADISAGISAGVGFTVLVRSGKPVHAESSRAEEIIDSITDLPDLIAQRSRISSTDKY